MSDAIQFFDPRPPVGVLCDPAAAVRYPKSPPADAERVELLDAELRSSGQVALQLCYMPRNETVTMILRDVCEGTDGCLGFLLETGDLLVFASCDRERVTAVILKLSTGLY